MSLWRPLPSSLQYVLSQGRLLSQTSGCSPYSDTELQKNILMLRENNPNLITLSINFSVSSLLGWVKSGGIQHKHWFCSWFEPGDKGAFDGSGM